jgi:hypothetical protein
MRSWLTVRYRPLADYRASVKNTESYLPEFLRCGFDSNQHYSRQPVLFFYDENVEPAAEKTLLNTNPSAMDLACSGINLRHLLHTNIR